MDSSMLLEKGLQLTLAGMGSVFAILTILVMVTALASRVLLKLTPRPEALGPTDEEIAAVTAAVAAHRSAGAAATGRDLTQER